MIVLAYRTDTKTWQVLSYARGIDVPLGRLTGHTDPTPTWDRVLEIDDVDGYTVREYRRSEPAWVRVVEAETSSPDFIEVPRSLIETLGGEALMVSESLGILGSDNTRVKTAAEFASRVYTALRSQL